MSGKKDNFLYPLIFLLQKELLVNIMGIENIVLEQVTPEEYQRMQDFWHKKRKLKQDSVYSRVINPLRYPAEDYERILFDLVSMEYANELCVNDCGKWMRRYINRILESEVREMARIAANDTWKIFYLEMKFLPREKRRLPYRPRQIHIEFVEYNNEVIGYVVDVPASLGHLIRTDVKDEHLYNWGLWVPETIIQSK